MEWLPRSGLVLQLVIIKKLLNSSLTYGKSILADQNNVKRRNNKNALESLPLLLFRGAFLANAIPHFCNGVMGHPFQSPFASPPGQGCLQQW